MRAANVAHERGAVVRLDIRPPGEFGIGETDTTNVRLTRRHSPHQRQGPEVIFVDGCGEF